MPSTFAADKALVVISLNLQVLGGSAIPTFVAMESRVVWFVPEPDATLVVICKRLPRVSEDVNVCAHDSSLADSAARE